MAPFWTLLSAAPDLVGVAEGAAVALEAALARELLAEARPEVKTLCKLEEADKKLLETVAKAELAPLGAAEAPEEAAVGIMVPLTPVETAAVSVAVAKVPVAAAESVEDAEPD